MSDEVHLAPINFSTSGNDPRPKKTCFAKREPIFVQRNRNPSSIKAWFLKTAIVRRIQRREINRVRKRSPVYCSKTLESSERRRSLITSAAKIDSRRHGSRPPAVRGETAPAASPINRPFLLAICKRIPPTGILPPRV